MLYVDYEETGEMMEQSAHTSPLYAPSVFGCGEHTVYALSVCFSPHFQSFYRL